MTLIEVVKNIAIKSGEILQKYNKETLIKSNKGNDFDIVTEADQEVESFIRKELCEHTPDYVFLGEESFEEDGLLEDRLMSLKSTPFTWVVDPLDGTSNFSQGVPFYSVSISLFNYDEVILGVVYNPQNGELYHAQKNEGAYLNGVPISVSSEQNLKNSVVGTGFTTKPLDREINLKIHQELSLYCGTIRALGSAALHLAYVASGKLDGFIQSGLYLWDTASGIIILKEAGGMISEINGNPFEVHSLDIYCSNGKIHSKLIQKLNDNRVNENPTIEGNL